MASDFKQTNASVRYQFIRSAYNDEGEYVRVDFPVRDTWEEAADDAVKDGSAVWENDSENELRLSHGIINRVRE